MGSSPILGERLVRQLEHYGEGVDWCREPADMDKARRAQVLIVDAPQAGHPAIQALMQQQPAPTLVVVAQKSDFATRLAAVRAGARGFLVAPVDPAALADLLDEFLTPPQGAQAFDVLLVDDAEAAARYHASLLQDAGMVPRVITDPGLVFDALVEAPPDLVVLDMHMPGCSGTELAAVIRQDPRFVGLPIVFLSAEKSVERQIGALRFGAEDFLVKPVNPEYFVSSVAVRAARHREMHQQMRQDSLTGLLNHVSFKQQLAQALKRAHLHGQSLSFGLIDIDYFKQVNDHHGHLAGDQVLRAISRLLRQRTRPQDLLGRYGGEEFALAFIDTDLTEASRMLEDLRERFATLRFGAGDRQFQCTLSGGLTSFPQVAPPQIIHMADKALYEAKRLGRNHVVIYGPQSGSAPGEG